MENTIAFESTPKARFMAILSYLGILCLVPMLMNKSDAYVNFHARQGLVLWIWGVLAIFGLYVPVVGRMFFSASALIIVLFSLLGMVSVVMSKAWKLPLVGRLSDSL